MADKITYPITVPYSELKLGDVVELFEGPYGTATVTATDKDGTLTISRPYGATENFSYGGDGGSKVIFYTGMETGTYHPNSTKIKLWSRKELR